MTALQPSPFTDVEKKKELAVRVIIRYFFFIWTLQLPSGCIDGRNVNVYRLQRLAWNKAGRGLGLRILPTEGIPVSFSIRPRRKSRFSPIVQN